MNCEEKHNVSVVGDTASSMSQLKEIGHCGHYVFTLSDLADTLTCLWGSHLDIVHMWWKCSHMFRYHKDTGRIFRR